MSTKTKKRTHYWDCQECGFWTYSTTKAGRHIQRVWVMNDPLRPNAGGRLRPTHIATRRKLADA